jgi:hypothetical protein
MDVPLHWWDDLHAFWCELPNYNPHSVQSSDPGFQHAADAVGPFSMPAGEDGDEDALADGGSPGWDSRIGSDKDVDLDRIVYDSPISYSLIL